MTVTELYTEISDQVDELQKQMIALEIKHHSQTKALEEKQKAMARLRQIAISEGDRELSAEELTAIGV